MPRVSSDVFGLIGSVIDAKFRVDSVIGEGGFGVVYRGEHLGFDAPIAIKCLKLPPHFDLEDQERLVRGLREEGRLLLKLSQRTSGIVQALDVGAVVAPSGARVPYLILEWLEGETLSSEIRSRAQRGDPGRSLRQAMDLLDPAVSALAVAHKEKIAHRDIKPENLFLVGEPGARSLKILDFGIAKVFADAPSPSGEATQGISAFTPGYGAPEQFERKRGATGPWTDVYALALVLVEVIVQRRALEGDDLAVLYVSSTDQTKRPTLRRHGLEVPDEIERVLSRALAVSPNDRYADARAFWDELRAAVEVAGDVESSRAEDAHELGAASTVLASSDSRAFEVTTAAPVTGEDTRKDPAPLAESAATEIVAAPKIPEGPKSRLAARRPPWAAVGALALVVLGAAALWQRSPAPDGNQGVGAPSSSPASASASSSMNAVPRKPEVEAAVRDAQRAWRDGDESRAIASLERATTADAEYGGAYLRLALWQFESATPRAREAYAQAGRLRASLDERELGLLKASAALFQQPWDLTTWAREIEALTLKYPNDVELLLYLGHAQKARLRFDDAVATFDRVIAVDPELVPARLLKGDSLSMKGDGEGQAKAYRDCLAAAPGAVGCQEALVIALGRFGRCQDMLREAKQLATSHADLATAHDLLASALEATGAAPAAVLEAVSKGLERLPKEKREIEALQSKAALLTVRGELEQADGALSEWEAKVSGRTDQLAHALPALRKARLYLEIGKPERAGEVAQEFLNKMGAWTEPTGGDLTMNVLPFALRGRKLTPEQFAAQRDAWVTRIRDKWKSAGRELGNDFEWITWSHAFGAAVDSKEEALLAVSKMPAELPAALASGRWPAMDYNIGRAHLLAGQPERAVAPLRRAAHSCHRLSEPTLAPRALLAYGAALEAQGDKAGAKAAYEQVLGFWGKAKPGSVTAKEAKKRLAALD